MTQLVRATIKIAGLAALIAIAATAGMAKTMPAPSIAILDVQKVLRESQAAKSLIPQMERLRTGFQGEVRKRESALRDAGRKLRRERGLLAPEAYAKKQRAFDQRAKEAQRQVQLRKRSLDRAFGRAIGQVRRKMIEVAGKIASERKINIVLVKSAAILSRTSLDITPDTLKRLNKLLPKVTVKVAAKK